MKIVLTGGGTGGHFYPLISVANNIKNISRELRLIEPRLYFIAPKPFDEKALFDNDIIFKRNIAGKKRVYFSPKNIIDYFKTALGILTAIWTMFLIYPDVVFSKGGHGAFPVLVAARLFQIPVIIHESDSVPGRVNIWSGKFAKRVAISYEEASEFFPKEITALTGNPIRKDLIEPAREGAREYLNLDTNIPTLLVLGGSQGAERINEMILSILPDFVEKYQVIHQTGHRNIDYVKSTASITLKDNKFALRYKPFAYLDNLAMKMSAGATDLVISRSGSQIFEIASWGLPSILVPIPESISRDQRSNAFAYASSGAAIVIEEKNLTPHLLLSEVDRILSNDSIRNTMAENTKDFAITDAGEKIAREIINIGLEHES